ncbi:G kinase-anchoring protein 1-like isoform X1 [Leptidea sinapis]|uniref:G kinase-anchoring protein 1-like isoform X1 n=1 Tax=Leptidea sinapis TaxID=189913 RepID=UPI00212312D1|nr:G kinase-anchoring protein 1-like isoform X1 [Leptidea sinapis]XP_050667282.1 G kinase-anchoring protein 1-like isoform X1 [Leptidea sinapis]XP_050667283.1 G kinase-anchoring protein 1-like isoform X1 [Leptidea sinapis]
MAAVIVQSRFAGLKIEDDENANDMQKPRKNKVNTSKKTELPKKNKVASINNNKTQVVPKKRKAKPNAATSEQWEMWKQKDEELVHGSYESELQQAIILSKLDFEEKKDVYKQLKKVADTEKKAEQSEKKCEKNKKSKKKNVMSLDQFNEMVNPGEENKSSQENGKDPEEEQLQLPGKDTKFFERVQDDVKNEMLKDKIIERVRNQPVHDEIITKVQYKEAIERKEKEITELREEVTRLKDELFKVKTRNRKLCNILGQGEMKDKAEVLVEVERLRAVQVELNTELASLHSDLEKERSKNADPRSKDKRYPNRKKNVRFDVSSEALLQNESSTSTV